MKTYMQIFIQIRWLEVGQKSGNYMWTEKKEKEKIGTLFLGHFGQFQSPITFFLVGISTRGKNLRPYRA